MTKTKIEWCDRTWNPVTGCLHGCEYCYARGIARRFAAREYSVGTLSDKENYRFCEPQGKDCKNGEIHVLDKPLRIKGQVSGAVTPYPYGFDPTFHRYLLDNPQTWKKPSTVFVGSMCDLFGEWVPDEWIATVFAACAAAPQHRYLFLTKNPHRYAKIELPDASNFWFGITLTGASVEDYTHSADADVFLSIEPLLGELPSYDLSRVKWVIIGAETGNRRGKITPKREWVEHIVNDSDAAGVPVLMKRGELLNAKSVKAGKEEPRYFMRELMGAEFRQDFPWEV
jgi:protein gp37